MKKIFSHFGKIALAVVLILITLHGNSQDWKTDKKVNVLLGLNQLLILNGFNIEGNYIHNRLIIDYSHGASLDFNSGLVNDELRRQGVVVHMPWTTGFGIGYRLAEWINIRIEPKWHRFEFYYDHQEQSKSNQITAYNTFSLGIGLYGSYQPFRKSNNSMKGIMISPSIRYWPTVDSTLPGNAYTYFNQHTMQNETIKTLDPGVGFTPLIINVSIGYSFRFKAVQ